ncbi:MAG: twin-arginine translocation signal domain-containing protein, partial [Acidobacteriaceae bacterium]|nr:twin-arginine translocation signal domain-containing protein [Acidobacteriaceae bacterium]
MEVYGCGCAVPRRGFLKGAAALAASAILPDMDVQAQAPAGRRVDIHSHFAPPQWLTAMNKAAEQGAPRNNPLFNAFKDWTPATSVAVMDQAGVATSMLSITTPGIWFFSKYSKTEETRRLARDCN